MTTTFRYDYVGSFLRPAQLKKARQQFSDSQITVEQLKIVEDKSITELVEKQKEIGLKAITDGEFRRSWWHLDFFWGLNGVERTFIDHGYAFNGVESRPETARLVRKISGENHPFIEHFKFLLPLATNGVVARQTIPAPAQFLAEIQRPENIEATKTVYPSDEELHSDIAKAYKTVIEELYAAGCRHLQLDDCTWGMFCDEKYWNAVGATEDEKQQIMNTFVVLNNEAIQGLPEDLTITTHVCRGNYRSTWASSGGYEQVAPTLFSKENVESFLLEFDTDRSGGFEPLQHVSEGKKVVLGILSSKLGELEDKEEVKKRIKEASKFVDLENLCLSPQCGFASTEEGNNVTEEQQWAKLRLVKEIAEEVWE